LKKKSTTVRTVRSSSAVSPEKRAGPRRSRLVETRDKVKLLCYGDSGTGKTTGLATLARRGRVLFIDAESGVKAAALARPDLAIPVDNIEIVSNTGYDDLQALVWELRAEFAQDPDRYIGVVLDSMTEIQAAWLAHEMQELSERAARRGVQRDPFEIEGSDWQRNTSAMRQLIRDFRELPCHVGFAARLRADSDKDGVVTYGPQLTPKVADDLIGYVDIVLAMQPVVLPSRDSERRTPIYSAFTRRAGKWRAKDRFGVLPTQLVEPSFDRLVDYISGDLAARHDPLQKVLRPARTQ
jgi:hypothetical protein